MMILVAHVGNNALAAKHFSTKVVRSWTRRPHLAAMAVKNPVPARLNGVESMAFQVDLPRFERSMELIARGVTYHQYQYKWSGRCKVWSPSMLPSDPESTSSVMSTSRQLMELISQVFAENPLEGTNPEVFQYRIHLPSNPNGIGLVQLVFYGGFNVCVMFAPEGLETQSSSA